MLLVLLLFLELESRLLLPLRELDWLMTAAVGRLEYYRRYQHVVCHQRQFKTVYIHPEVRLDLVRRPLRVLLGGESPISVFVAMYLFVSRSSQVQNGFARSCARFLSMPCK